MKLIRESTFETNSSSTHTVTVSSKEVYDTLYPGIDGTLIFEGDSFYQGSPITTVLQKCNYYLTGVITASSYYDAHDNVTMFKKVVSEHTGALKVLIDIGIEGHFVEDFEMGYVKNFTELDLKNFLFGEFSSAKIVDRDYD